MPGELDERMVGDLRVVIDRTLCVGFGDCVTEADEAFALDEESIAIFRCPEQVDRDRLLRACDACPVDAITVYDGNGQRLVP